MQSSRSLPFLESYRNTHLFFSCLLSPFPSCTTELPQHLLPPVSLVCTAQSLSSPSSPPVDRRRRRDLTGRSSAFMTLRASIRRIPSSCVGASTASGASSASPKSCEFFGVRPTWRGFGAAGRHEGGAKTRCVWALRMCSGLFWQRRPRGP